jgi:hypothetical protein
LGQINIAMLECGLAGERGRIRTCDPCLKRALLYQLSYAPTLLQTCRLQKAYLTAIGYAALIDSAPVAVVVALGSDGAVRSSLLVCGNWKDTKRSTAS